MMSILNLNIIQVNIKNDFYSVSNFVFRKTIPNTHNFIQGQYKSSDDGIEEYYEYRLREYEKNNPEIATDNENVFHCIDGDYFKVPKEIWEKLYK